MVRYKIFPPIGIARLGESDDYFLGPEVPGQGPTDPGPNGVTIATTRFKDASLKKIRKQAARFHVFESADGESWVPARLPENATVTWRVSLTNKKSAVVRSELPPVRHERPQLSADAVGQVIDGGSRTVSGKGAMSARFVGTYKTAADDGAPYSVDVELGMLRTDDAGRLIVLGGKGFSSAPADTPIGGSFYVNPNWHDDVADGPVTAEIRFEPGAVPVQVEGGAWVIVGPPDFAPGIAGVVTLYDVLRQVGIDHFGLTVPPMPSFDTDIAPILARVRHLQWVHDDATWSDARLTSPKLRSRAAADQQFRAQVRDELVLPIEEILEGHVSANGPPFRLRPFQKQILEAWVQGNFDDTPVAPATEITAAGLTRAALEGAVGQGFCPGIEAGIIMLDPTLYAAPFDFRIGHAGVQPGDLTALMAQPWQADFLECHTEWWPTQRPDIAPQADGSTRPWVRGAADYKLLVANASRLGIVVRQGDQDVFVEVERDPTLPEA
jgi:hypothetical protein